MKIFLSALENGAQCKQKGQNGKCLPLCYYLSKNGVKYKYNLMSYYYLKNIEEIGIFIRDIGIMSFKELIILGLTASAIEIIVALCDTPFLYWAKNTKNIQNN